MITFSFYYQCNLKSITFIQVQTQLFKNENRDLVTLHNHKWRPFHKRFEVRRAWLGIISDVYSHQLVDTGAHLDEPFATDGAIGGRLAGGGVAGRKPSRTPLRRALLPPNRAPSQLLTPAVGYKQLYYFL